MLLSLLLLPLSTPVMAGKTAVVVITATGYVVGGPAGFVVTYISDYEIGLSWTLGVGANNTMVRAAFGRLPADRTDGYLVYYGNSTSATDWVNIGTTDVKLYYRAWSETAAGAWNETAASGWTEGVGMTFIGMIVLCAFLMVAGFWRKSQAMLWVAAIAWIGFAFWQRSITPEWGAWDLHEIMFYVGFLMTITCIVEAVMIYRGEQPEPEKQVLVEDSATRYRKMMQGVKDKANRYGTRRRRQ